LIAGLSGWKVRQERDRRARRHPCGGTARPGWGAAMDWLSRQAERPAMLPTPTWPADRQQGAQQVYDGRAGSCCEPFRISRLQLREQIAVCAIGFLAAGFGPVPFARIVCLALGSERPEMAPAHLLDRVGARRGAECHLHLSADALGIGDVGGE